MTGSITFSRRSLVAAAGLAAVLVGIGWLVPHADADGNLRLLVGASVALALLGALCMVPVRHLPLIALGVTFLVPTETTVLPHVLQGSALGLVPIVVWLVRAPRRADAPVPLQFLACMLGVWFVLSEAYAPLHTHRGSEWLLTATIALVAMVLATPAGLDRRRLRSLYLGLATVLGAYALLEGFVLHHNPLFAGLFDHNLWWKTRRYSASYRVTTLLGHPLFNGLVFSSAAVLAASELVERRRIQLPALLRFAVLVGATDATRSRGAAIALALGILFVILFSRGGGASWRTRRLVLSVCAVLAAVVLVYGLQARDESREGQSSAQTRITVIKRASEALSRVEPFGAGPGESDAFRKAQQLPGWEIDLENSYAELVVSLGIVGALLLTGLLVGVVVVGLKRGPPAGEAAALLTIMVSMAGFNAIEGHKPVLILISLLAAAILGDRGHRQTAEEAPTKAVADAMGDVRGSGAPGRVQPTGAR